MAGYRDPNNYSFSYGKETSSLLEMDEDIAKIKESGGAGGTTDYNDLRNKPQINDVELVGDKTSEDLKIKPGGAKPTVSGETIIFQ